MSSDETVAEVLAEFGENITLMRKCKCVGVSLWDCLKFKLRIEAAHKRERREWAASLTKQRAINKELVDENADLCASARDVDSLRAKLKVAEDALDKIYRCVDLHPGDNSPLVIRRISDAALTTILAEE